MSLAPLPLVGLFLAAFACSCALTRAVLAYLSHRAILDHPNDRSSHSVPTPRGGGWGIVLTWLPALLLLGWAGGRLDTVLPVLAGAGALVWVSWRDDRGGLPVRVRFGVQIAVVLLGLLALPDGAVFQGVVPFWLDRAAAAFLWLWFLNLFNFMDGIDGIAGTEAASIGAGLAAVALLTHADPLIAEQGMVALGAALGFLVWNWHPARVFMGDVGSVPVGYLFAWLLLGLAAQGHWAAALLIPFYFLADATITLLRRLAEGKKVWQAHREHIYQRAVQGGRTHAAVTLRVLTLNLVLIALALVSVDAPWRAVVLGVLVTVGLMVSLVRPAACPSGEAEPISGASRFPDRSGTMTSPPSSTADRPPRLLFVATEDWFFCSHFLPLARAARAMGLEVVVATRVNRHRERLEAEGIRVVPFNAERGSLSPVEVMRGVARLSALFRAERPDIVHLISLRSVIVGGLAARLTGMPAVVLAVTGTGFLGVSRSLKARALRTVLEWLVGRVIYGPNARFLLENPDDGAAFGRWAPGPRGADGLLEGMVIVNGAGIDPDHFTPLPLPASEPGHDGPVRVAIVARMVWSKGVDVAVEAVRALRARGVDIELLLAGGTDPSNPDPITEDTLRTWSSEPGIRWLGPQTDVREVWKQVDIALLPTRGGEGLPRTLLEAAACARPVVTTDVPGCRSLVRDGVDGYLVPPGDAAALTEVLGTLATDSDLRARMAASARARVVNGFREVDVANAVTGLYRDMLGEGAEPAAALPA